MALDNANFIAELSITDPPGTDPLSQGDDQIRTIKRATFQSFPNIAAQVSLTDAQLNLAAIKNEANVFTAAAQTLQNGDLFINQITDGVRQIIYQVAGVARWSLRMEASTGNSQFNLRRSDIGGVEVDKPFTVDFTTGIVDFAQPPTVAGAPLWIAGEVRQFVDGAANPGANWFYADGTNGTIDLRNRILMGDQTAVAGTLQLPNLVATAAAGTTGSTAITTAQMPVHNHNLRGGGAGGGITDVAVGFASTETVTGANRGNTGGTYVNLNSSGNRYIDNAGSGSGHTHTSPAQAVTENGTNRDTVRPLSAVVRFFQYVP